MGSNLGRVHASRKTGAEPFRNSSEQLPFGVLDFWQWSCSDLLSNATRGILAEYIVARALAMGATGVRDEWAAYDLQTPEGIKVEVKSASYLQSWHQTKLSNISFRTPRTLAWDPDTSVFGKVPARQANVYVVAVLAHKDKSTVDPLDLAQWEFFVLPTTVLDQRVRSQHSITLPSLKRLAGQPVTFEHLGDVVRRTAAGSKEPDRLEGLPADEKSAP